jgi:hypothetical protein
MSEKPEALRLADDLRARIAYRPSRDSTQTLLTCDDAARCLEEQHAEIDRLKAENEALRRDAERYRWMKQEVKRIPPSWDLIGWDAAIDAAMKAGT